MRIKLAEEIQSLLNKVSALVNLYDSADYDFVNSLKKWFVNCEQVLIRYRKPQVSELASLRGLVSAAEKGIYEASFASFESRTPRRKKAAAIAIFSLHRAQSSLQSIILPLLGKLEETETIIKNILTLCSRKGQLSQYWKEDIPKNERLKLLWKAMTEDKDTAEATQRVLTLISYSDALQMIDRIMTEWSDDFKNANANLDPPHKK